MHTENPNVVHAILRTKKKFYALREFTLEGGQQEIERQVQLRKEQALENSNRINRTDSHDGTRTPVSMRSPNLSNVPEEHSAFAIGDDDESEEDDPARPLQSRSTAASLENPRSPSIASSAADDTLPTQLRGMSEKARGKMPAGARSFSRTNSISSLHSLTPAISQGGQFNPSPEWVCITMPSL
jgi:hypothetical protein